MTALAAPTHAATAPHTPITRLERPAASFTRLYVVTMILLAIMFTGGIALFTWLVMDDLATGLGVGVMSSFWGAPGFGIMIAGSLWSKKSDQ